VPQTGSRTSFTGLGSREAVVLRDPAEMATMLPTTRHTARMTSKRTTSSSSARSMAGRNQFSYKTNGGSEQQLKRLTTPADIHLQAARREDDHEP